MPVEPTTKRAVVFFDGQNLFYAAKEAFGYSYPNYDPKLSGRKSLRLQRLDGSRQSLLHGVPSAATSPTGTTSGRRKLAVMGTRESRRLSRSLRYRNQTVSLPDGTLAVTLVGQEKVIDVRIALDIVRFALESKYDVALIFSQDQDLSEAVEDVKKISALQNRSIKPACAYPTSPASHKTRGINGTEWIRIDRATYDACTDPNDYRPKRVSR